MVAPKTLLSSFVALALTGTAFAATVGPRSGIFKTAPLIAPQWQQIGQANHALDYTLTFTLHPANQDGLTQRMQEISASGGPWLSAEEVASYVGPKAEDLTALQTYLKSQGIADSAISYSAAKDTVTVQTTVGKVAEMFAADMLSFVLPGTSPVARAKSITIPAAISSAVLDVAPILNFGQVFKIPTKKAAPSDFNVTLAERSTTGCSTSQVTPTCLRNLYQTSGYTPVTSTEGVTVMGYIDQYASQSDLTSFLNRYRPDAASATLNIQTTAGAVNDQSNPGDEANLDVQTVVSQSYPLKTTFLGYGNSNTAGDIFSLTFQYLLNQATKPGVVSISYGSDESDMTSSQAQAMCNYAQQLTAQGTTIVVSSGDSGVAGQKDTCPKGGKFIPTYPSGCPYILSVGATQNFSPEQAVSPSLAGFWSGAGFSNYFSTPSYQSSAVSSYESAISSTSTYTGNYFNKNGRAFPDVSSQGSNYLVCISGSFYTIGGTSASAPTWAAVLALLNDARVAAGKSRVGWIHPTIYGNTGGLTDLTSGASRGCGSSTTLGFPATSGYDASTGLGTPVFPGLRSVYGA
ncbi:hypothetical protein OC861_005015 [Tilletia horrida]|nr:hypothetical protein OC861_005015 [Tilletia horrida]